MRATDNHLHVRVAPQEAGDRSHRVFHLRRVREGVHVREVGVEMEEDDVAPGGGHCVQDEAGCVLDPIVAPLVGA